jgi:ankyrin repeat protein
MKQTARIAPFLFLFFVIFAVPVFGQSREELADNLRKAIDDRDIAAATSLLEAGADPNGLSDAERGRTFLMTAVTALGSVQLTKLLLDYGADPNLRDANGESAAHFMTYTSREEEILNLLAAHGARFDITGNNGISPLMEYAKRNCGPGVNFLLDWENRHSPGYAASLQNRKEYLTVILSTLVDNFAFRSNKAAFPRIERLLNDGADPRVRDGYGAPVVFRSIAPLDGDERIARLLIERGAPVDGFDRFGDKTLLMLAGRKDGDSSLVDTLLRHGADPNQQNRSGETALMYTGSEAAAALLLAHGADPNIADKNGRTALMHDAPSVPAVQKLLLQGGADAAYTDNRGNTALHDWYYQADASLLEQLLLRGCPLDAPNNDGITPLMRAASNHKDVAILLLLEKGADAGRCDNRGKSVLCKYLDGISGTVLNKYDLDSDPHVVVAALLAAGARPADTDNEGNSALLTATRLANENREMVPIRDMIRQYASADERETARATVEQERQDKIRRALSKDLPPILGALSVLLFVGGMSIWMRKGVYRDNPSQNWMGSINGVLNITMGGTALGFLLFMPLAQPSGNWSDMFSGLIPIVGGSIGGVVGLFGGIILTALVPSIGRITNNYAMLYYLPTAASVFAATSVIIYRLRY